MKKAPGPSEDKALSYFKLSMTSSGESLPEWQLYYETFGELSEKKDNVIIVHNTLEDERVYVNERPSLQKMSQINTERFNFNQK